MVHSIYGHLILSNLKMGVVMSKQNRYQLGIRPGRKESVDRGVQYPALNTPWTPWDEKPSIEISDSIFAQGVML